MKKAIFILMAAMYPAALWAQFSLPKVEEIEKFYEFDQISEEWEVTFGKGKICDQHGKLVLSEGEVVNFCREAQSNCGLLHQHFSFKVKGDELVFRQCHESLHGIIIREFRKLNKLDEYRKQKIVELKILLKKQFGTP
ncbi:hypothetical protein A3A09_03280 [Candidatus Nomurabacteria bacterium RIFCSPLOWO2_01_FULL_42_20]|uniref:Uncharacterized protein n=1 Tax=Candidatus Nomurabacteria bacterium RIFCSPHIGHO2_01_FULL_42_16 TaxID=1801743 RepID=A0A1F6VLQ2_9BACT|nr:MAG: hypothetical protein A2824_00330 [Candidatus Nomurabacteria bacterium RIFCSPHIGHO2_01_FULL_42_16]OGI91284.1 MAG: hypothetical protein A3A09_03280 [Candidatus Nomurabacteria bacterium RIFCSPLOWO2_01_FULL_42_20]